MLATITNNVITYAQSFNNQNITTIDNWSVTMAVLEFTLMTRQEDALVDSLHDAVTQLHKLMLKHQNQAIIERLIYTTSPDIEFLFATHAWYQQPDTRHARAVQMVIDNVELAGIYGSAHYLTGQWNKIRHAEPTWHNNKFHPLANQQPDVPPSLSGSTLKQIRKFCGLSLADVSVDWTPATQSRFENMKTTFGFITVNRLIDALMTNRAGLFTQLETSERINVIQRGIQQQFSNSRDPVEQVRTAIAKVKDTVPANPTNVHDLRVCSIVMGGIILTLYTNGLTADAALAAANFAELRKSLINAVTSIRWLQPSDIAALSNLITVLSNEESAIIWRQIYTHSRFDFTDSDFTYRSVVNTFQSYAMAADIPHLRQLDQIFGQIRPIDGISIAVPLRAL